MKRGAIQFLFLIFVSIALASAATLSPSEQSDVSVPVDRDFPIIEIHSPQNTTYNNATQILINFTITELTLNAIWYSLNYEQNITISQPIYLNFSEGNYVLTIYANDSLNRVNSSQVSFTINNTINSCGDAICSSQESCSICQIDCGSCQSNGGAPGGSGSGGGGGGDISLQTPDQNEDTEIPEQERNQTPLGREAGNQEEKPGIRETEESKKTSIFFISILIIAILVIIILIIIYQARKRKNKNTGRKPLKATFPGKKRF